MAAGLASRPLAFRRPPFRDWSPGSPTKGEVMLVHTVNDGWIIIFR